MSTTEVRPSRVRVQVSATRGPMRKISLRNLRAHKVRLLLTLISVLLGTAFVAGSFVFTDTLKGSFDKIFTSATKGIDAQVAPRHDYNAGVPTSLVDTVRQLPGVRAVQPEITAPLVLVNGQGKKVDSGGAPSEGGVWTSAKDSITTPPTFVSGHAPAAATDVVINQSAATKGHLHTGDRAKVVLPNAATLTVTISGIYHTDTATGGYIGVQFTQAQAMKLFTDGSHLTALDVAARPGVSERVLTDRIAKILPSSLEAKTGTEVRDDATSGVASALSFVNYILFGFGLIALIVGTFIIYNTFSMLVAQRLRELALLRAIGADRKQIRRSVVFEAGVIGVIGSVLGLAAGVGLAYGLHALLDALDLGLPSGGLVLKPRTIIVSILLGTVVTLLSAYAPARRASRIAPVAAMREEFSTTSVTSLRRRTWIGSIVAAVGVLATLGGLSSSSTGSAASLTGLGLVAVCAGAMLLSPVLAGWVITPLGRLIGRPFGPVGRLARTNAVRNPRRTAATAFALTLGLVLVSGIAVIGASMKSSLNHLFDANVTADYILTSQVQLPVPSPAAAAAARAKGVGSLTELHNLDTVVDGKHRTGTGVDGPLAPVLRVDIRQGTVDVSGHNMVVSKTAAEDNDWKLGASVVLARPGGATVTEKITGIYADDSLLGPWLVSGEVYRQLTPRNEWSDEVALVKATPGANLDDLRASLEEATDPYYVVDVSDRDQFKGQIASQVNGLLGLLYGLLGLAIVIAVLGIINTLALSVVERRREIGMLRAVGMQRKQVRRTLYLESLLIAVFGAALGLVLGVAYGALFTHTLSDQGLDHLSVPWIQAAGFLVLAAVVGVLAALWPGIRAARTSPLQAIAAS